MIGARVDIVIGCTCAEGEHIKTVFTTATPGLVVGRLFVHDQPPRESWVITHQPTGLALPAEFGDPETAMGAAAALAVLVDWTMTDPIEVVSLADTTAVLDAHGATPRSAIAAGDRVRRNEVSA
jgi:hypothetical protein